MSEKPFTEKSKANPKHSAAAALESAHVFPRLFCTRHAAHNPLVTATGVDPKPKTWALWQGLWQAATALWQELKTEANTLAAHRGP